MTDHTHTHTDRNDHGHDHHHDHPHGGAKGFLYDLFVPHTHDSADSIDDAMEASTAGVRALKISLFVLLATTVLQAVIVAFTGSIALLADTIHNFADALTAVPLWIAFVLGRRVANRRYTYGYGRAEDLAGMFIVFVVALSAVVAGWQAVDRFIDPRPIEHPWLLVAAGLIGFAATRPWRSTASASARRSAPRHSSPTACTRASTGSRPCPSSSERSASSSASRSRTRSSACSSRCRSWRCSGNGEVHRRPPHGRHRPGLVSRTEHALEHTPGVEAVRDVRLRWVGHRLTGSATVEVAAPSLHEAADVAAHAAEHVHEAIGNVDEFTVVPAVHAHQH